MQRNAKSKTKFILVAVGLISLFLVYQAYSNFSPSSPQENPKPSNTRFSTDFISSKPAKLRSTSYQVNYPPECYGIDCHQRNNYHAYERCSKDVATNFNILGVKHMERYVSSGSYDAPIDYPVEYLKDAYDAFKQATEVDKSCLRAKINFALAHMQMVGVLAPPDWDLQPAIDAMSAVIEKEKYCRHYAVRGYIRSLKGEFDQAQTDWDTAFKINPRIGEGRYMGIIQVNDTQMHRHQGGGPLFWETRIPEEFKAISNALLFTEFSPISLSDHALLLPDTHRFFVDNRYSILRRIVPPFILREVANFYKAAIDNKVIQFGDPQSQRYYAGNDRVARYLHYALTDLIRKVIAHNSIPTYTYFGGYVEGAELTPHTDRHACEFTLSLTIYQDPANEPWDLGLGNKPLFERDDETPGGGFPMPPEEEQVRAPLHQGDGLLFMGRHLVHWRYGKQKEGHHTYNIFLHYVQSDFKKFLD